MPATQKATLISLVALMLVTATTARAQYENGYPHPIVNLEGPRFGFTVLSGGITDKLKRDQKISIVPIITQFGWQMEKQFNGGRDDVTGLTEIVFLVGGMEQNVAIPSLSWIVGARTKSGFEFGIGPNVTPVSTAIVYVAGMSHKVGDLNVPLNVSVVPSVDGVRLSVLTGFNLQMFRDW